MALQLSNISKSYGVDVILENISMNINDNEKVGLIGVNGAGKTTLLRIIAGDLPYDGGTLFTPKDARVGFLRQNSIDDFGKTIWNTMMSVFQDVVQIEENMRRLELEMNNSFGSDHDRIMNRYGTLSEQFDKMGGFELRARIMTILNGMGFGAFDLNMKVELLSGGEKTKLAMAKLLLESPEILLLDEPTNHLDFKTMQWLEGYLKSYRGCVITVSHDRYFLDSLVDTIYEIERNKCTRYTGNYSAYLEQKKQNYEIAMKHYSAQQKEIKRLEEYVDKNGVRASTAKQAKSRQKMIDRMEVLDRPDGALDACKFAFELVYPSYKDVLTVNDLSIMVNKSGVLTSIASNITFDVKKGEKIALIGANGVGKSTLLKTILGKNKNYDGYFEFGRNVEISYYDQEQEFLNNNKTVLDEIWDKIPRCDESQVRGMLGSMLFRDEDVFKMVGDLSGGERARLLLLIIMLEKANTLFLDEPTNHLDLPSKEALDTAMKEYEGTVFFVSHDRYFLNKIADKIYELTPNGIVRYNGNYDDYLANKEMAASSVAGSAKKSTTIAAQDYETTKRRQANIKNKTKKMEQAELLIEQTESNIEELNKQLEESGSDYDKVKDIYSQLEDKKKLVSDTYELWNNLSEELELLQAEE
ncbi:MAG: ABC-F family ATP-binding cassette domain-containing protein [Clostridia bacterium]|nr:ABC-F family ATP-binding cassette domain-containing protein [Clostridia bacterium]